MDATNKISNLVTINALAVEHFTLSISENSIRSSSVQLRPMGEMLSIPFLNSMNVPLQAEKDVWLGNMLPV